MADLDCPYCYKNADTPYSSRYDNNVVPLPESLLIYPRQCPSSTQVRVVDKGGKVTVTNKKVIIDGPNGTRVVYRK